MTLGSPPHRARSGHVHGSGGRLRDLSNLCSLPACNWSLLPEMAKIIPCIFPIMVARRRTMQGMARFRIELSRPHGAIRAARAGESG